MKSVPFFTHLLLSIATITVLIFPYIALASTGEVSLEKTIVSFEVPNNWKRIRKNGSDTASLSIYEREAMDVNGLKVSAIFMVFLQKLESQKFDKEAYHKSALKMPGLSVIKEITNDENLIQVPGKTILGRYINDRGLEDYVYAFDSLLDGDQGMIVVVDGLKAMFDTLDPEYHLILRSIKLKGREVAEVKNDSCKEETPVTTIALLGTWQSMDDPFKDQCTYKNDGTFDGYIEDNGLVTWKYSGNWNLIGNKVHTILTSSSLERIPIGTEDDSEILSIRCGTQTYRSQFGNVKRYKKITN